MMQENQQPILDSTTFTAWVSGEAQALPAVFRGVTQDSRKVTPGCLYVALRGERFDGHDFVGAALRAGAAAALVEQAWRAPAEVACRPLIRVADTRRALGDAARAWRLNSRALIVGLTGSSGKTTTKEMAAALFSAGGAVCATRGNLNNEIGLPLSVLAMPGAAAYGIFELGTNHPGEIGRLADVLRPQVAIISSIGAAHIEHFGSIEAIAREKGALLQALPSKGFAVLSLETEQYGLLAALSAAPVVTVSLRGGPADFVGELTDLGNGIVQVRERAGGQVSVLRSGLPGEHNAANLLLAFAAARTAGVPAEAAAQALLRLTLPGMRWEVSRRHGVQFVNDAYNANPQSMKAVLKTFLQLPCAGKRWLVLGDMLELGGQAEALHRELGRYVAELMPDGLIAVGLLSAAHLSDESVKAGFAGARVARCSDAAEAAAVLKGWVRPGDSVLLKASRGMRLEKVLDEFPL